jgi:hypothetical protein
MAVGTRLSNMHYEYHCIYMTRYAFMWCRKICIMPQTSNAMIVLLANVRRVPCRKPLGLVFGPRNLLEWSSRLDYHPFPIRCGDSGGLLLHSLGLWRRQSRTCLSSILESYIAISVSSC